MPEVIRIRDHQQKHWMAPDIFILTATPCTLGRRAGCGVTVTEKYPGFNNVSKLHAEIVFEHDKHWLVDHSRNGIWVNGIEIPHFSRHLLAHNDVVGFSLPVPLFVFLDEDGTPMPVCNLEHDEQRHAFAWNRDALELSKAQYVLMHTLWMQRGELVTREQLADAVYGQHFTPDDMASGLDAHIKRIRATLRELDPDADVIRTEHGWGFRLMI